MQLEDLNKAALVLISSLLTLKVYPLSSERTYLKHIAKNH